MTVEYEWRVEVTQTLDGDIYEAGEILESEFYYNAIAALHRMNTSKCIDGCHFSLCVVRSVCCESAGVLDQQFAYVNANGWHFPTHFADGCDFDGAPVPNKIKNELAMAASSLGISE